MGINMIFRVATLEDLFRLEQSEQAVVEAERPFNDALKAQQARYYDLPFLIADSQTYLLVVEHQATIIATGYVQIRTSK